MLRRRRGQPLTLALIALEVARRLDIPLQGVNFPGHFMLRVPGADHLLDPCGGRRLYTRECRDQLYRQLGPGVELSAEHLQTADAQAMLRRLSRNLRMLHMQHDEPDAALKDAERALLLGPPGLVDHLARADVYRRLDCPQGEMLALLGPSGCGKSSTLKMIAGIESISRGDIFFDDRSVSRLGPAARDIAMVFEDYALYPHLTVKQNIAFPLSVRGIPKRPTVYTLNKKAL